MTPLERALRGEIARNGPIPLARYMDLCNAAYYASPGAIGAGGAFTTAPEVSQIFGELIGLWTAQSWLDQGAPAPFTLLELGPGRGVMMADMLRAAGRVPGFLDAANIRLVERSEGLRAAQAERLARFKPLWAADAAEALDDAPLFVVANEFFDALGLSQWRWDGAEWRAIGVGLASDRLAAQQMDGPPPPPALAARFADPPVGAALETRPEDATHVQPIVGTIARRGGAALVIDYGYDDAERRAAGGRETVQALRAHRPASLFDAPGAADITAHVNFDDLAALAAPLRVSGLQRQGPFLRALGAEPRAAALAKANPARTEEIAAGLHRLTHPNEMGRLFRVMALTPPGAPPPPGFSGGPGS